jgi:hypothetical protein
MLFNFFKTKVGADCARMIVYDVFCDSQRRYYDNYKSTIYIIESIHQAEYINKYIKLEPVYGEEVPAPFKVHSYKFFRHNGISKKIRRIAHQIADSCGDISY